MPRAALDVAPHRDSHDHRTGPGPLAAPPHGRDLVSHLHETRPQIVAELDFDDRAVPAYRHAAGHAGDTRLSERGVHDAPGKRATQAPCNAEDATFRIGDVLSPHDDSRIAVHLFAQA